MMDRKTIKTELLSPAGNMDCLTAAVKAGADAIYLAGKNYGARASADNFDDNELIDALDYVHTYNRKIYLTLNTLIKQKEWGDLFGFIAPLYEAGLDGIIIQDIGLIGFIKKEFPLLPIHASTQMTVTHQLHANLLKDMGVCRVVPARELSLTEIKDIKEKSGLEVEAFIHGAMCYCYSGACLFSSFLGGRSGNRGRCAGPCRLPYNGGEYPLSMKDMCLIDHIGELMDAGIDSFKIEGRLKSPEYVYGVTKIYRKYMDLYSAGKAMNIDKADRELLDCLYQRGGSSTGYLCIHNGKDMISLSDPSYSGPSQEMTDALKKEYENTDIRLKISGYACFHVKHAMRLSLVYDNDVSIEVTGDEVQKADKRAATKQEISDRIKKTGNTPYIIDDLTIEMDDDCFIPVGALNELRRKAIEKLTFARLSTYGDNEKRAKGMADGNRDIQVAPKINETSNDGRPEADTFAGYIYDVSITESNQLKALRGLKVSRIYIPYDLIFDGELTVKEINEIADGIEGCEIILSLPRIYRSASDEYMDSLAGVNSYGILIRNLAQLAYIKEHKEDFAGRKFIADNSIYVWNRAAYELMTDLGFEVTMPLELNGHELADTGIRSTLTAYGKAPLMVSANCILKTHGMCRGKGMGFADPLSDRQGQKEPVYVNCIHCFNEIFNAKPTSLHNKSDLITASGATRLRLDMTDEDETAVRDIVEYYISGFKGECPVKDFTTGHIGKGAL